MKKPVSILLALVIIFAFAACGQGTQTQSQSESTSASSNVASTSASSEAVDSYFTLPSSRDPSVEIPVGVTVPSLQPGDTCPVVLLVHGFLGSKDEKLGFFANATDETYAYQSITEQLLALGIGTIRIDQSGCGDSKDDFRNYTMVNSVSDLQDAYDYCMANYSFDSTKVGLVGWSMGGKVGPLFVSKNSDISTMVLLNPAADNGNNSLLTAAEAGLDWEVLKAEVQAKGEVYNKVASDSEGRDIIMSKAFFDQVDNSKTGDEITAFIQNGGHGLMVYGDQDTIINPTTYQWVISRSGMEYYCVPGMDHVLGLRDRPDITRIVLDATVSYLYRYLSVC